MHFVLRMWYAGFVCVCVSVCVRVGVYLFMCVCGPKTMKEHPRGYFPASDAALCSELLSSDASSSATSRIWDLKSILNGLSSNGIASHLMSYVVTCHHASSPVRLVYIYIGISCHPSSCFIVFSSCFSTFQHHELGISMDKLLLVGQTTTNQCLPGMALPLAAPLAFLSLCDAWRTRLRWETCLKHIPKPWERWAKRMGGISSQC